MTDNSDFVYSTTHGRMCPVCNRPMAQCAGHRVGKTASGDGIVRVGRETKGRKGKGVTVVTGVPLPEEKLADLARQLKQKCGAGGTVRDGVIEIQGEHRDGLAAELERLGYKVKRVG